MIKWPWVSRVALEEANALCDVMLKEWNDAESRVGSADSLTRLISAQLDAANARLSRIAALETPNAAHGVKKAVRIAKGLE